MRRFGRQEQFWMIAGDVELCVDQMHPPPVRWSRASWIGQTNTHNRAADGIEIAINGEGSLRQPYIRSGLTRTRAKMPFAAVAISA
jgi:hypothetical protein